eukprot:jgi/Botrbrau1/19218/Bobra.0077s0118.1
MSQDAGVGFANYLRSSGLPEILWDRLLEKIEQGDVGCAGHIQAVVDGRGECKVIANNDQSLKSEEDVYIIVHAFSATRADLLTKLRGDSDALAQCGRLMQFPEDYIGDVEAADDVFAKYWSWARPAPRGPDSGLRDLTEWYLEPPEGLWMRHSESPTAVVVPLPPFVAVLLQGTNVSAGASIMWVKAPVPGGTEITRDLLPGTRSLQRAAALVAWLDNPRRWSHPAEFDALKAAVQAEVRRQVPPGVGSMPRERLPADGRLLVPQKEVKEVKTVWSNYPLVPEALRRGPFRLVQERASADIVFTPDPCSNFLSLPSEQMINQFPYEGCIIRKDLLPQTLRQLCSVQKARRGAGVPEPDQATPLGSSTAAAEEPGGPPDQAQTPAGPSPATDGEASAQREDGRETDQATLAGFVDPRKWRSEDAGGTSGDQVPHWFPAAYDLATEVQHFIKDFKAREEAGTDNHWVVKLAQGARSADACLAHHLPTLLAYRQAPGGDRVVQKYVLRPILYDGRKFDVRVCILVKSFNPLDAYLYRNWHVRCANKPYSLDRESLTDFETHFTVACYDDDAAVREAQLVVKRAEASQQLQQQGVDIDFFEERLQDMARDLVLAASYNIGSWPRSRALYGCDVMVTNAAGMAEGICPLPQLLEVNFCPDFGYLIKNNAEFVDDVFQTLFTEGPAPDNMLRLFPAPPEQ